MKYGKKRDDFQQSNARLVERDQGPVIRLSHQGSNSIEKLIT
jgi:hypothetical protein